MAVDTSALDGLFKVRYADKMENLVPAFAKAAKVILWWMNQTCPACNGTKLGPSGRGTMCRPCKGTGKTQPPFGEDGKRLANWIDCCVELARGNIGQRRSGGKR